MSQNAQTNIGTRIATHLCEIRAVLTPMPPFIYSTPYTPHLPALLFNLNHNMENVLLSILNSDIHQTLVFLSHNIQNLYSTLLVYNNIIQLPISMQTLKKIHQELTHDIQSIEQQLIKQLNDPDTHTHKVRVVAKLPKELKDDEEDDGYDTASPTASPVASLPTSPLTLWPSLSLHDMLYDDTNIQNTDELADALAELCFLPKGLFDGE